MPKRAFWILLFLAFIVRLSAAVVAPHPGIADSNHYYNLAKNLSEGRGFVIDYIWNYHNPPADVTHPTDYWMPLPAIPPAIALSIIPDNLLAALIPSVLIGTLVVGLTGLIAAWMRFDEQAQLLAMICIMFLPEMVLNSARTDTTMLYVLFITLTTLAFYRGMQQRHPGWLLITGICAGLAQLSRQDGMIVAPALILCIGLYARFSDRPVPWRWLLLIPAGWIGIMMPWFLRNLSLYGVILPSGASRTLFMTSFIDQFTYGRELDLQHYLDWGTGNIVSNIAFQAAANVRMVYLLQDVSLPVISIIGAGLLLYRRDKDRLLLLALPIITGVGLFVFYSILTPFHTQGGSFKKSIMLLLPFLAVMGGWALTQVISTRRMAVIAASIGATLMLLNAFQLIRADFGLAAAFDASIDRLALGLEANGDINGDGEIIVMAQDPFILAYHGYRAIMLPSDPRDMILDAAYRYNVDYIMMPADRAALDALYDGSETDPRLQLIRIDSDPVYRLLAVVDSTE